MTTTVPGRFASAIAGLLLGALAASQAGAWANTAPNTATPAAQEEKFDAGTLALSRFTLQGDSGPPVRYVLARPGHKAPLVLYIQGSGCIPPFPGLGTPKRSSTIFTWLPLAAQHRYAVMAVDKPYQPEGMPAGQPGTATSCPHAFDASFSYDSWLATLTAALRHALTLPDVDRKRVLIIGMSEGSAMAAGLARAVPEVTHVALLGGPPGTTQLYDFVVGAYRNKGGNKGADEGSDEDKLRRLQELDATVDAINADPRSTDKFFAGHTYLRWSSFFAQSHGEDLAHSRARVYLASGMQDMSVPILSTEVAYARLRGLGRDVTFRRVPNAGHGLVKDGLSSEEAAKAGAAEYDALMAWFERR
jgi:pimeloyl-ACP methyl ester carboxylesterase